MRITSSAFEDGKAIPTKYAYHGVVGGKNVSLPLSWNDPPPQTASFALSIVDPHPVAKNWIHWLVVNIPPTATLLAEGSSGKAMPPGSKELRNTYGTLGYGGPEPPKGSGAHPYEVTLFALSAAEMDLPEETSLTAFQKALGSSVIASAKITGIYER